MPLGLRRANRKRSHSTRHEATPAAVYSGKRRKPDVIAISDTEDASEDVKAELILHDFEDGERLHTEAIDRMLKCLVGPGDVILESASLKAQPRGRTKQNSPQPNGIDIALEANDHWVGARVDLKAKKITIVNSVPGMNSLHSRLIEGAKTWGDAYLPTTEESTGFRPDWDIEIAECPVQKTKNDCGIHVIFGLWYLSQGKRLPEFIDVPLCRFLCRLVYNYKEPSQPNDDIIGAEQSRELLEMFKRRAHEVQAMERELREHQKSRSLLEDLLSCARTLTEPFSESLPTEIKTKKGRTTQLERSLPSTRTPCTTPDPAIKFLEAVIDRALQRQISESQKSLDQERQKRKDAETAIQQQEKHLEDLQSPKKGPPRTLGTLNGQRDVSTKTTITTTTRNPLHDRSPKLREIYVPLSSSASEFARSRARHDQEPQDHKMYEFDWQKLNGPFPMDEQREATLQRFFEVMETERVVVLRNTPVQDYIDEAFSWAKELFRLDDDTKKTFQHGPRASPHRGYSAVGQEKSGGTAFNHKESFDFGNDGEENRQKYWPPEESLPDFYPFMKWFFDALYMFQMDILGLIEEHYHLTPGRLTSMHSKAQNELRLLHYPGLKTSVLQDPQKAVRFGEHTDFGTLTVLFQHPAGGLNFQSAPSAGGGWIEVMSGPTDAIVTFGDTFERWTNGHVHAGRHRVQAPSEAGDWIRERYSIAYFCKADPEQSIGSLPEFRTGDQQDEKTMTFAQYNYSQQEGTY